MPPGDNPTRPYTLEERERCMLALALHGGSVTRAREFLAKDPELDRVPGPASLTNWMHEYAGRYNEILTQVAPQLQEKAEQDYRQIRAQSNAAHLKAVELASSRLDVDGIEDPEQVALSLSIARDASQTAKNIAVGGGIVAQHLALAEGRPTSITEHKDPDQLLRAIEAIAGKRDSVDSTAEDVTGSPELASPVD